MNGAALGYRMRLVRKASTSYYQSSCERGILIQGQAPNGTYLDILKLDRNEVDERRHVPERVQTTEGDV